MPKKIPNPDSLAINGNKAVTDPTWVASGHCQLLSVGEVADRLRLSQSTVMAMLRQGSLKSIKIGARRLVALAQLEDLIRRAGGGL